MVVCIRCEIMMAHIGRMLRRFWHGVNLDLSFIEVLYMQNMNELGKRFCSFQFSWIQLLHCIFIFFAPHGWWIDVWAICINVSEICHSRSAASATRGRGKGSICLRCSYLFSNLLWYVSRVEAFRDNLFFYFYEERVRLLIILPSSDPIYGISLGVILFQVTYYTAFYRLHLWNFIGCVSLFRFFPFFSGCLIF